MSRAVLEKPRLAALALALALAWAGGALAASEPPRLPDLAIQAEHAELARAVRAIVAEAAPRLTAFTGASPARISVEVPSDRESFLRRASELGGPAWAEGLAVPSRGHILLLPPRLLPTPDEFRFLLMHELMHLYLDEALRGRRAPLWLEEGLAMLISQDGGWDLARNMARGALVEDLIPLGELETRFPSDPARAAVAYAQSYYLVTWLLNTYGEGALRTMLAEMAKDKPLTSAVRTATGQGLTSLESDFAEHIKSRFSWLALITAGGFFWGLVALAAAAALVARRRRQRPREGQPVGEQAQSQALDARHWPPPPARGGVLREAGLERQGGGSPRDDREESAGDA